MQFFFLLILTCFQLFLLLLNSRFHNKTWVAVIGLCSRNSGDSSIYGAKLDAGGSDFASKGFQVDDQIKVLLSLSK